MKLTMRSVRWLPSRILLYSRILDRTAIVITFNCHLNGSIRLCLFSRWKQRISYEEFYHIDLYISQHWPPRIDSW